MSDHRLRAVSGLGSLSESDLPTLVDTAVINAILDVPAENTVRLLANVVATLEDAVISGLDAIDQLREPHQIILHTTPLAQSIRASAVAAGATGVATIAARIEELVAGATDDVSRDVVAELCAECHAALQGYLSLVFERYLIAGQ